MNLLSSIIPFAGSGLVTGYAMGFALEKILKWISIIVGFLAGTFFGILGSTVNWDTREGYFNTDPTFH